MIRKQKHTKRELAAELGISRSSLYYISKLLPKDWELKVNIEKVLEGHPSYGYRRVAGELNIVTRPAAAVAVQVAHINVDADSR